MKKVNIKVTLLLSIMLVIAIIISVFSYKEESSVTYKKALIKGNVQEITIDVSEHNYQDIVVQKGIPVTFNLKGTKENLNSCNNTIEIPNFNIEKKLSVGDNYVTFTPNETGVYYYTCYMDMIRNKIVVVDDINNFNETTDTTAANTNSEVSCH